MIVIGQHSFCEGVEENGSFRNLADGIWEPSFSLFSNSLCDSSSSYPDV